MPRNRKTTETDNNSQNEAPEMTTTTQEFDFAALAAEVTDSEKDKIERNGGAGRPKGVNPFAAKMAEARDDGKVKTGRFPEAAADKVTNYLRRAADDAGHGLSLSRTDNGDGTVTIEYQAKDRKETGSDVVCPVCGNTTKVTAAGTVRVHGPRDNRCAGSNQPVNGE